MNKTVLSTLISLIFLQAACSAQLPTKPLEKDEFKREFLADCKDIKTIYEGHNGSGYYFKDYSGGAHTKHSTSLSEMASWLRRCGVNPSDVSQILE